MKKIFYIINAVIFAAVSVGNYFYLTEGGLLLKSLCSGGFALMGLVNLAYALVNKQKNVKFHGTMSLGLILAMLGDIVISDSFVIGAGLFALGHVCFLISYCFIEKIGRPDVIASGILIVSTSVFVLFCPWLSFDEPYMQYVCLVYAFIISMMLGKAIGNFTRRRELLTGIILAGSLLFFFSDLMLVFDWFTRAGAWTGKLCMATYYPAECLLAFSIMHFIKKEKTNE